MRQRATLSIRDVAAKAGVSTATVSRVLNNGTVREATRTRVQRVIDRLGYEPDLQASTLRKGRTRKIGLVMPDITNPAYALSAKIAHENLRSRGYSVLFGITYGSAEEEVQALHMMRRERVSGIILNTCEGRDDTEVAVQLERLVRAGIGLALLGKENHGLEVDTLSVDNAVGVSRLVEYLARTGRKRIGFIAGDGSIAATRGRLSGFRRGMKSCGLAPPRGCVVCEDGYSQSNGEQLALRVLQSSRLDALVCGNDIMAYGAMQAAEALGIAVPRQLAVAGFDDIPLSSLVRPKLTTVRQPFDTILKSACDILVARIEGNAPHAPRHHTFEPELVVRQSA